MTNAILARICSGLSRLRSVLVNEGPAPFAECLARQFGRLVLGMSDLGHPRTNLLLFRLTDLLFDGLHGTNTGGVIDLPEMEGNGRNYVATPPRAWKLMMRRLPIDPGRFTCLDLGCGKGRTLLLAARTGFRRVIGVDISSSLLARISHKPVVFECGASQNRRFGLMGWQRRGSSGGFGDG